VSGEAADREAVPTVAGTDVEADLLIWREPG
jgi:hypothetical protein